MRLGFEAMEYGDEPHYPKDEGGSENVENIVGFGPVADFNFDGVAVSMDGVDWYEIQDLRSLRSDKVTLLTGSVMRQNERRMHRKEKVIRCSILPR